MPRVAGIAALIVAGVALIVVFTRPQGSSSGGGAGEVFLQSAGNTGPDPFTESTARESSPPASPPSLPSASASGKSNVTRAVNGSAAGLYGGTRKVSSCDVERQITSLAAAPAKNKAFASVEDIEPSAVPAYLRSLTPVQLRLDTRVTNHGYRDGAATGYQAVLQAGTAVLVDDRGVPRVRCACGNPLLPPVALQGTPRRTGDSWPAYRPSNVVVVSPAPQTVDEFVMYDSYGGSWFTRQTGDTGAGDQKTEPPVKPSPSTSESTYGSPSSPSHSPSSASPKSESPSSASPSSESPTSESRSPSSSAPSRSSSSPSAPNPGYGTTGRPSPSESAASPAY